MGGQGLASDGWLVTFGVVPDAPETGYGYIKKGAALDKSTAPPCRVSGFVEKPDLETAQSYVDSGDYLWNSGIFMMRASAWLTALERFRPDIARACRRAQSNGHVDGAFYRPGAPDFLACPSESIDYAVMEKAAGISPENRRGLPDSAVMPLDAGWSDVGAWSALWQHGERDSAGNVIRGDVYAQDTEDALLVSQHRLVAAVGVRDTVVVETADAVLVAHKDSVQDVKEMVQRLKEDDRPEAEAHRKGLPALGQLRGGGLRAWIPGQAPHGQPRRRPLPTDAPPPGGALGRRSRHGQGHQGRRGLLTLRKRVHLRPKGRQAPPGEP